MTSITFEILGQPFGKQRPRFGRGRTYTPKETVSHEALISHEAKKVFAHPFIGPVELTIWATFKPAKSWSKKKTQEHLGRYHTQKPDKDNIEKAIMDGLNGIAYADDCQVSVGHCHKIWGPVAKTVVTVKPLIGDP